MRIFVALEFPEQVKDILVAIQRKILDLGCGDLRLVLRDQLHLTLHFFGEVPENKVSALRLALDAIKFSPFTVRLGQLGILPQNKDLRIVYIDLLGQELLELVAHIQSIAKEYAVVEDRAFLSHITIARVKFIKDQIKFLERLERIDIPSCTFKINSFVLKESKLTAEGAQHRVLKKYIL
ncbi:MAG: RNA 2',3'-cyclic phosphodiesterase [Candidatus Babeliales bacterium]